MPKTISQLVSDFQTLTNDSSTSSGTLAKTLINFGLRTVLGTQDWTFNKDSYSTSSGTSIQGYRFPYNALKLEYLHYWDSNVWYPLKQIRDERYWRQLNNTVVTGLPTYWFVSNRTKQVELFPIPSNGKGTIKIGFTKKIRDVSVADYATGTISAAGGGTIFSAIGSAWGTIMEGRSIKVEGTNTPIDGFWFEIEDVTTVGSLMVRETIPNTVSGVSTYTISELIPLPDGFEDLPLWYGLDRYYQIKEKPPLAREYERKYKEQLGELLNNDSRSVSGLIEKEYQDGMVNPNENPWSITIS